MHAAAAVTIPARLALPLRFAFCRGLIALLLYLGVCHPAVGQGIQLRYAQAYSALRSIFALPLFVAEREGFFVREGLSFSMLPVSGGGERLIAALHDGTADIAHVATPFLIQSALAGSDAVAIAAEFNNPIYSLIAKPEVRTYADLKGKLIGMAAETGSISVSIRKLLTLNGLHREDFRTRFVDGTSARLTCVISGDCDAAPLGQPQDFVAVRRGYRLIGRSTEAVPEYLYTVTAVRRSWATANKDTLVRYVRALAAAFAFIRDPARRADVVRTVVETTGFDEGNAALTLDLFLEPDRGVLPKAGEISPNGMAQSIALMGEGGILKAPLPAAERFIDLQYLHAAGIR
jgi:ABC-type nitrate/sulfonate/bicarbonate transport system substrate-binding protein